MRLANNYYYDNSLSLEDTASVNKVALNNPIFAEFNSGITFNSGSTYSNWQWNNWYKDSRFKTTLDEGGSKQAFALSYGDIHTIDGVGTDDNITSKLDFTGSNVKYFWLRSAGFYYNNAGYVYTGDFNNNYYVLYTLLFRPALSIQIK